MAFATVRNRFRSRFCHLQVARSIPHRRPSASGAAGEGHNSCRREIATEVCSCVPLCGVRFRSAMELRKPLCLFSSSYAVRSVGRCACQKASESYQRELRWLHPTPSTASSKLQSACLALVRSRFCVSLRSPRRNHATFKPCPCERRHDRNGVAQDEGLRLEIGVVRLRAQGSGRVYLPCASVEC